LYYLKKGGANFASCGTASLISSLLAVLALVGRRSVRGRAEVKKEKKADLSKQRLGGAPIAVVANASKCVQSGRNFEWWEIVLWGIGKKKCVTAGCKADTGDRLRRVKKNLGPHLQGKEEGVSAKSREKLIQGGELRA